MSSVRRQALVALGLLCAAQQAACPFPAVLTCEPGGADCPEGSYCDGEAGYCVELPEGGAPPGVDAASDARVIELDATTQDLAGSDAARPDVAGVELGTADLLSADHTSGDAGPGADVTGVDVTGTDMPRTDGAAIDLAGPDSAADDAARTDTHPTDVVIADSAAQDSLAVDTVRPDSAQPDSARPDSAQPDSARPDTSLPDTLPADWWDTAWGWRRKLSFDNSQQGTALQSFPVLITLHSGVVDYGALGTGGEELRFIDPDNGGPLAHEIEEWNPAGTSYIWVKVPSIDASSSADFIWMYYDNSGADDVQNAPGVWSNGYRAVWHLNEAAIDEQTSAVHASSTGGGNNGAQSGNTRVTGHIGGAQLFDGTDDYIEVAESGLTGLTSALSIEAWARIDSADNDFPHVLGGGPAGTSGRSWQIWWETGAGGYGGRMRVNGAESFLGSSAGTLGEWSYVILQYDGSQVVVYVDTAAVVSWSTSGDVDALGSPFRIGDNINLHPREFNGAVDEVRISEISRSADWIAAQHLSMTLGFVSFDELEQL